MFLNFFSKTEAGHVLKMFLQFWPISASRSYKLGSYKRKNVYCMMHSFAHRPYPKVSASVHLSNFSHSLEVSEPRTLVV